MTRSRVTAILYSRLAMSLRSLAIILLYIYTYYHSHPRLQPYSYKYHMNAYEAEHWRMHHYTIITFSVNRYVSLTEFGEFTSCPMCNIMKSTIENTVLQTRYRSIISAKHRVLIIAAFNWVTWQQRSKVQRPIGSKARHQQWWGPSRVHDTSIRPCHWEILQTIDLIELNRFPTSQLSMITSRSNLQWTLWSYPWIDNTENQRQHRETINESAQLQLHSI